MKRRTLLSEYTEVNIIGDFLDDKSLKSNGSIFSVSGFSITPFIKIPEGCREIVFNPCLPESLNGSMDYVLIEYNDMFNMSSSDSYWCPLNPRQVDIWRYGVTKYVRFTISTSNLLGVYLKDMTHNQILFNGQDYAR